MKSTIENHDFVFCHPEGIFAVVDIAVASNSKDPFRMTPRLAALDSETLTNIWKALKPDEDVPEIDFKTNLVLFARNTQFYNHISIGKVILKNGIVEVMAMETMSAMPIEDKVAFSLAVVPIVYCFRFSPLPANVSSTKNLNNRHVLSFVENSLPEQILSKL